MEDQVDRVTAGIFAWTTRVNRGDAEKLMKEISEAHWYDYVIINEQLEETVGQLKAIIIAERCRKLKKIIVEKELTNWEENHGKNYGRGLS